MLKKPEANQKAALAGLVASLLLQEGGIKIALSSVTQKALRSTAFVLAPPDGLEQATYWLTGKAGNFPVFADFVLSILYNEIEAVSISESVNLFEKSAEAIARVRPTASNARH